MILEFPSDDPRESILITTTATMADLALKPLNASTRTQLRTLARRVVELVGTDTD